MPLRRVVSCSTPSLTLDTTVKNNKGVLCPSTRLTVDSLKEAPTFPPFGVSCRQPVASPYPRVLQSDDHGLALNLLPKRASEP